MDIRKITDVVVTTTDGQTLQLGDMVIFNNNEGKCFVGGYNGLNRRGALEFMDPITHNYFAIMPKSIVKLYKAYVELSSLPFGEGGKNE